MVKKERKEEMKMRKFIVLFIVGECLLLLTALNLLKRLFFSWTIS